MPIWVRESALSWADEKHGSVDHIVRPVEPVDGSKTTDGYGRVARLTWKTGRKTPSMNTASGRFEQIALRAVQITTCGRRAAS
ncbi:hypothetical protein NSMM_540045 [Nitrosomonas mobilis]|uniref:Uncharacterized protein n=1 Tax=Nitrosomonas mobilis TaxID=51642 RepID=A0A1G5SH70_9PROT|nr:hypothetical protein NSMM_540045 [Nitrosomonas mobilis]